MYNNEMEFNQQEFNRIKQVEQMKRTIMSRILSKEALERLARVRAVNPQQAGQVEAYLLQIYQTGKLNDFVISDEKLRDVLKLMSKDNKGFNIRRL
jgi:DNA-binding TFAR19-related protein (PDSD5 family)